ncbi:DNA polymerase [Elusimicrobium posterum]|uniref:uracil-DNA glycosylase family protein n=1 Tax=Elusimicrobium posterum TaxID=3116653 RepID=UPI003C71C541
MKDEAKKLIKEFKVFLSNAEEDDFLITGANAPVSVKGKEQVKTALQPSQQAAQFAAPVENPVSTPAPIPAPQAQSVLPQTKPEPTEVSPVMPKKAPANADKETALNNLAQTILTCKKCPLGEARLNAVPGEGNPNATVLFIGEGPGFDEDHKGRPFIGRAGTLLTKMIEAMGIKREEVFIANMVKCHPMVDPSNPEKHGNDRAPSPSEIAFCRKYIEEQIRIISPKYIVALGGVAAKSLLGDAGSLGALRNKIHDLDIEDLKAPVKVIATYHPAALLRNPAWKKDAWADLQVLMRELGLPIK